MVDIYKYLNYRDYLKDFLPEKKKKARHFSHRYIHQKLEISPSSGFLANVISGKKNLTSAQIIKMSKILGIRGSEATYFENLVFYNHAKSIDEKNNYLKRLMAKRAIKLKTLASQQLNLFSEWHLVFLRELLSFMPVKTNYEAVASMFDPPISEAEVRDALDKLESMGLIKRNSEGVYQQIHKQITTGDEVESLQLAKFQLKTMDMAKRALETFPQNKRDISFVTLSLSEAGIKKVKKEISRFRKQLLKISDSDPGPDSVYQGNFQFFAVVAGKNGRAV